MRWEGGVPELLTDAGWERVDSIDGVPIQEVVRQAKRRYGADWKLGFIQHFRRVASAAGAHPVLAVRLGRAGGGERRVSLTSSNRRQAEDAWLQRGGGDDPRILARWLEEQYAYLELAPEDVFAELAALRRERADRLDRWDFGLRLQAVLARLGDPHTGVLWSSLGEPPERALPLRLRSAEGRVLAEGPGGASRVLDEIEGLAMEDWLSRLSAFVPAGSPAFRRHASLLLMERHFPIARRVVSAAPSEALVQVEARPDGADEFRIEGRLARLRLAAMRRDPAFLSSLEDFMRAACGAEALLIDLRDNAGGRRDAIFAILPHLIDAPRVINFAALRTAPEDDPTPAGDLALADRFLFPVGAGRFTPAEREAIQRALQAFRPEWLPPRSRFSGWYATVVSPGPAHCRVRGKVAVLMNEGSLSATEVLLGALKGLPEVTLIGQPSGGAGGWPREVTLPGSGIAVRMSSMASFLPDGQLYLRRGVQPDRVVSQRLDELLRGVDTQEVAALEHLRVTPSR